jgi:hypothetical protein
MRQRAAVIAGGNRDQSSRPLFGLQRQYRVGRAAQFEAASGLMVFQFHENGLAVTCGQAGRLAYRRAHHVAGDALPRLFDQGQGD